MTNKVLLSDAVLYEVDEIQIENDPEKGSGVCIKLINYKIPDDGKQFLPASGKEARRHMALSCTRLTCFRWNSEDPPAVFVDGIKIEPNPQQPEKEEYVDEEVD